MTATSVAGTLESLRFDNRFIDQLPGDPIPENSRRQVNGACYSRVRPLSVPAPVLVAYSAEAAALLDLPEETCRTADFTEIFSGRRLLPDMEPYAMCYGGHQFGTWAGQLGDGRAINLGEIINRRSDRWVLQLKGAGPTPYARGADGRAVLRSSLREFICSEAMHHLGIPTTRALSLILTGEQVVRDMFYDGHPRREPGAVICRLSPSFTRFGNFEILAARGETELLERLVGYTIRTDFPHLDGSPTVDGWLRWFTEVCARTAELIVHWMRVGFVHGVMNTDNMSVLGLTIDYGPYGWLEGYDPSWTPNTTDAHGRRYCFGNQPAVAQWNLTRLARALYPLVGEVAPLQEALEGYGRKYLHDWRQMMLDKLGLTSPEPGDDGLIAELLTLLSQTETDMTIFFRRLGRLGPPSSPLGVDEPLDQLRDAFYRPDELTGDYRRRLTAWLDAYRCRLNTNHGGASRRQEVMNRTNPKYIFRNYLAQLAIDKAEQGDFGPVGELLDLLRHPYDEQPDKEEYAGKRPEWARHRPGCSMLSCSS